MKPRLTPELAYVIGLWKTRRTKEGIGVKGSKELLSSFVKGVLEAGLTTPDKLLTDKNKVYFYHSKYRKFFQDVLKREKEVFRYKNDYSAAFLAGLFDARGGFSRDGKTVYIANADVMDELVVLNAGFKGKLIKDKLIIVDRDSFIKFIGRYAKMLDSLSSEGGD